MFSRYRASLCRRHLGPCRCRIELAQPWQDLLGEQGDVGDRVGVVEEAALPEHQQVAEAARSKNKSTADANSLSRTGAADPGPPRGFLPRGFSDACLRARPRASDWQASEN